MISCTFYLREPGRAGGFRYTAIEAKTAPVQHGYPVAVPPNTGDVLFLAGVTDAFRVVDRQWTYPDYGSAMWRWNTKAPTEFLLTVIVERAVGVFADEESEE